MPSDVRRVRTVKAVALLELAACRELPACELVVRHAPVDRVTGWAAPCSTNEARIQALVGVHSVVRQRSLEGLALGCGAAPFAPCCCDEKNWDIQQFQLLVVDDLIIGGNVGNATKSVFDRQQKARARRA